MDTLPVNEKQSHRRGPWRMNGRSNVDCVNEQGRVMTTFVQLNRNGATDSEMRSNAILASCAVDMLAVLQYGITHCVFDKSNADYRNEVLLVINAAKGGEV